MIPNRPLVSFIVPALNEEENLLPLFGRLLDLENGLGRAIEIVVVDDCSADRTLEVARKAAVKHPQIQAFHKPLPHGLGRGIRFALDVVQGKAAVVVMADGVDPLETAVPEMCRKILEESCHLVLLSRYTDSTDSQTIPLSYKVGHLLFRLIVSGALGIPHRDTTYAFRAFDVEFVRRLGLRSDGFEISPEITFKTFYGGGKIGEVAGRQTRRVRGKSNFLFSEAARGYARILMEALGRRLLPPRLRSGHRIVGSMK